MKSLRSWLSSGGAAFAACASLAVGLAMWQSHANQRDAERRFRAEATRIADQVAERMQIYAFGLRGARSSALTAGLEQLTRSAFRLSILSRDPAREFPGLRGIGIVRRVPREDEPRFLVAARLDGQPDFAIRQLTPHEGERYVIQYIEPVEVNQEAVGLDIASERHRKTAAEQAMRSGQAALTGPITLVQASGKPARAFLVLLPIYRSGRAPATEHERMRQLYGWSYGALIIDDVLAGFNVDGGSYALALRDVSEREPQVFFASSGSDGVPAAGLRERLPLRIHGRVWEAEIAARPSFIAALNHRDPVVTLGLGLAVAGLLGMLSFIYAQSARRRAQISSEQARRAVIVATSIDAIVCVQPDGIVVDWNAAAERLFGYTAAEAIGAPIDALIIPDDRRGEVVALRSALAAGQAGEPFDTVRRARDGTLIDVSITASPIVAEPEGLLGIAIILRDIRQSKQAARQLLELNVDLERQVRERTMLLESALRENEALLRTIQLHAIVAVSDHAGRILDVNDAFCRVSGYARGELLGKTQRFLAADEHDQRLYDDMQRTVDAGHPWRGEVCNRNKDRSTYWLACVVAPLPSEDGHHPRLMTIATDITDTKHAEASLRASEAFLDRTGRVAGVGGWELDLRTHTLTWSAQIKRIHEVEDDFEPSLDDALTFFTEPDRARLRQTVRDHLDDGRGWDLELPLITRTGRARWVRIVGVTEHEHGRPARVVGAVQDVTERKIADARLQEANERSSIAADAAGIGVWEFDFVRDRLLCDERMYALFGWPPSSPEDPSELVTRSLHPEDAERVDRAYKETVQSGRPFELEFRILRPDGEVRHLKTYARPVRDHDGAPMKVVGVNIDITSQKRVEAALLFASQKAEQASLAKSQFLANMSHEIRTPMNAVIGFSYLLRRTSLSSEQEKLLSKIQSASKSLLGVINDVLDLSKIEAGELVVERVPFQLRELLAAQTDVAVMQAEAKGIAFALDVDEHVPDLIEGDATRLSQILTNLLSNAIKFTERGRVSLHVRALREEAERASLEFTVRDTGIGIAPGDQERLFAPFAQADASTTRRFGGTGLGLSIVKRLTELMGGEVGLRSELDRGSEFWVTLPFLKCAPSLAMHPETVVRDDHTGALRGLRVLVADDSYVNLELVKYILEARGAVVELACNGLEAVERLRQPRPAVDIVLMDLHMPVLDGHAATQRIRSELGLSTLPIIGLTAGTRSPEHQRAVGSLMNDFLTKPFDTRDLVRLIRRHCPHVNQAASVATRGSSPSSPPPNWPEIDGIDTAEVRARLDGDLALFASMLERVLDEFTDVQLPGRDETARAEHADRLHKLRGSAGMLSAKRVRELAAQAEIACRNGDGESAQKLCARLDVELRRMRDEALPKLRLVRRKISTVRRRPAGAPDFELLSSMVLLVQLLRQHDRSAGDQLEQVARALSEDAYATLRAHVDARRYDAAADLLQQTIDATQLEDSQMTA